MNKVIDMLCHLPTKEAIALWIMGYASKDLRGYLNAYGPRFAASMGMEFAELLRIIDEMPREQALRIIEERAEKTLATSLEKFVATLDEAGVEKAVFLNNDEETTTGIRNPNERLAAVVNQYPDKLIGFAGADPHKGMTGVRDLEKAVKELGLKGLSIRPFMHRIYANDRRFYPLYAKCIELDIPVYCHCSINFSSTSTMDFGRPIYVDQVACDFPELRLLMGHAGWPWIGELVAVAWRHPNIYIDLSAVRPRYLATENTGWEILIQYGNTVIQDKVVFGSTWFLLGMPIRDIIAQMRELPLKEEVKEKWLYKNAVRLLKL